MYDLYVIISVAVAAGLQSLCDLLQSPRCKICSSEPKVRSSNHLFLDLPKVNLHSQYSISNSYMQ